MAEPAAPATVRVGFLLGDVNQSRVVSVADLGLVNAQLAQVVTATNYLKDVNASGTLTRRRQGHHQRQSDEGAADAIGESGGVTLAIDYVRWASAAITVAIFRRGLRITLQSGPLDFSEVRGRCDRR